MLSFLLICFPFAALSVLERFIIWSGFCGSLTNLCPAERKKKNVFSTGTGILTYLSLSKCFDLWNLFWVLSKGIKHQERVSYEKCRAEVLHHFLVTARSVHWLGAYSWSGAVVGRVQTLAGKQGKIAWLVLGCLFFFLLTYRGLILQLNKKLLLLLGEDLVVDARREGMIFLEPACLWRVLLRKSLQPWYFCPKNTGVFLREPGRSQCTAGLETMDIPLPDPLVVLVL